MLGLILRFRQSLLLVLLLVVSLSLMSHHASGGKGFSPVTAFLFEATAALGQGLSAVVTGTTSAFHRYVDLVGAREELAAERARAARLQEEVDRLREVELENHRLKKLLAFKALVPYPMIPARVVGKDFNSWSRTLTLSPGRNAGIRDGMAVIRPEGVVGRVTAASAHYALVQLVIDGASDIPVIFQRTRTQGIVEGKITNQCRVKYLNRLADIRVGDRVVSSGLGGVFPKGLLVGTVTSVHKKPYGLFQEVTVTPAVDFATLEEVLVIAPRAEKAEGRGRGSRP